MANKNWSPGSGKAIPTNTPIKVDPRFTTVGLPGANNGFVPFNAPGQKKAYYSINEFGEVAFKFGPNAPNLLDFLSGKTYTTLNDLAADTLGANEGQGVINRTFFQTKLQEQLEERAPQLGIRPTESQPPPPSRPQGAQGAQGEPGVGDDGANQGNNDPKPNVSPGFNNLGDIAKDFQALNFNNIKQYFTYPESMNDGQDRIEFTQYKYVATSIVRDTIRSTAQSFANRNNELRKTKIEGSVTLPIPNQIAETNQTGWGESSLSTIGAFAMGKLGGASLDFSRFEVGSAFNKVTTLFGELGTSPVVDRARSFVAAKLAAQIISNVGVTVDPEAYINRVTGAAINPNLELLFNGPKLRPFSFSFKMTARSQREAKNIRAIIKFFKAGMAPQRSKKNNLSLYLGSPNVFQVEYKSNKVDNLDGIGRIKMCALQSCAINYTPDGAYAVYDDDLVGSQPIAIEMQLQLIEITPVFADEYNLNDVNGIPIGPDKSDNFVIEPESRPSSSPSGTRNYVLGAAQGPTPNGTSVDTSKAVQQALRDAGSTILPRP